MEKHAVRKLTAEGLTAFSVYLDSGPLSDRPPPADLLHDDRFSVALVTAPIERRKFDTKFDMGMHLVASVGKDKLTPLLNEPNVWPWLSLFFHESTFPKKGEDWYIGARSRHVIERVAGRQQDQSHRHLVRGAVVAVYRFGMYARVLMEKPHQQSKIEEQIMSRKSNLALAGSLNVAQLIYRLYWNTNKASVQKGAKGEGPGSIMRLISILHQLDATYDVASVPADRLMALLPKQEFKRFAQAA